MRFHHFVKLALAGALLCCASLYAQITSIRGRVDDTTGAHVKSAHVVLKNTDTGEAFTVDTTGTGDYTFVHLVPGFYNVTISMAGFATEERTKIHLSLDEILSVNVELKPGAASETVVVQTNDVILNTTNADRGTTFSHDEIENSPLNGGVPLLLANTAPGVQFTGTNNAVNQWVRPFDNTSINQFSVNGQGSNTNDFQLDGAPNNSNSFGSRDIGYVPPSASVQEMKFISNVYDAQYGHTGGGVFDIITKNGTNTLHGQLYENARRTWLDANSHYNDNPQIKLSKQSDTRDQYGFQVDGPVYVPKLYNGHDRTFFELQGENWSQNTPLSGTSWVPALSPGSTTQTVAQTGDFSQATYYDGSCQCRKPITIYDPLTADPTTKIRQPFANNQIPANRLDSVAQKFLSYLPLPNRAVASDQPYESNNYAWQQNDSDQYKTAILRLDQNFGKNDHGYLRYTWNKRFETRTSNGIPGAAAQGVFPLTRQNHFFTADYTHTISSNAIFDLKLSFTRYSYNQSQGPSPFDPATLGLTGISSVATVKVFPQTNIDSLTSFGNAESNGGNKLSITNTISGMPLLTLVKGAHAMKMGLDYRWQKASNFTGAASSGLFHASTSWTQKYTYQNVGSGDGFALATWLLGTPSDAHIDITPRQYFSYPYFAPFFQDDWKIRSNLTLNLGVRWDLQGPPSEARNQIVGDFNTTAANPVSVSGLPAGISLKGGLTFAGVNGQPNTIYNWNKGLIQPRIGFAWQVNPTTVFRGGFGDTFEQSSAQGYSQGFSQTTAMNTSNSSGSYPDADHIDNPFPVISRPAGASLGLLSQLGNSFYVSNRNFKIPGVWNYSFGMTQQLSSHLTVDVSYVGSDGFNQDSTDNINHVSEAFQASCDILHGATAQRLRNCLSSGNNSAWVTNPFLKNAAFSPAATGNQNGYYTNALLPASIYTRPFPEFGNIYQTEQNDGKTRFDSLQVVATHRWTNALTLRGNYVWSKVMDSGYLEDTIYRTRQHHVDTTTVPQRFTLNGVWHLPVGRDHKYLAHSNFLVDGLVGGWTFAPVYYLQAGSPFRYSLSIQPTHVNQYQRRRTVEGGSQFIRGSTSCVGYYNPNNNYLLGNVPGQSYTNCTYSGQYDYIVLPSYAQVNDVSDYGIRTPRGQQLDIAMSKSFHVYDRSALEIRFEGYNVLNHPSWQGYGYWGDPTDPHFGTINMIYAQQTNPSRQVQLTAKYMF